jgi:endonuclease YncB( thermonuclease family)
MKVLSLLFSLLLAAAVLIILLRPWNALETLMGSAGRTESKEPPANPPGSGNSTTAVNAGDPKPAVITSKPVTPPASATPEAAMPTEPKTHMLANEKAEAERGAALEDNARATTPAPLETKRYFKVKVRDAETLEAGLLPTDSVVIRLEGIDARDADETCKKENGAIWPCGAKARAALTSFIRYRAVTCTLPPGGETKDFVARCSVMGQDLSTWLVRQGWATPQAGAEPALAKALDAAKSDRRGLWQVD